MHKRKLATTKNDQMPRYANAVSLLLNVFSFNNPVFYIENRIVL